MKIVYKGILKEFECYLTRRKNISFLFHNKGANFILYKWDEDHWCFGLNGRVDQEQRQTNELYLWHKKIEDPFKEGKELYEFLFKKSPLRVKLLMELGADSYEKFK